MTVQFFFFFLELESKNVQLGRKAIKINMDYKYKIEKEMLRLAYLLVNKMRFKKIKFSETCIIIIM